LVDLGECSGREIDDDECIDTIINAMFYNDDICSCGMMVPEISTKKMIEMPICYLVRFCSA